MTGSPVTYTLREIAARLGGEIVGDPDVRIERVATLENAGDGAIAFLANPRYLKQLAGTHASAVIVAPGSRDAASVPRIVHDNPYLYFARVSALLKPASAAVAGIHPTAVLASGAQVDPSAEIGPYCVLGRRVR